MECKCRTVLLSRGFAWYICRRASRSSRLQLRWWHMLPAVQQTEPLSCLISSSQTTESSSSTKSTFLSSPLRRIPLQPLRFNTSQAEVTKNESTAEEPRPTREGWSPTLYAKWRQSRFDGNQGLKGEEPRVFLTSDDSTVVCIHPVRPVDISHTKPLRPNNPAIEQERNSLTEKEITTIRQLRNENGSMWTINTLARLYNVKRALISKVAPANQNRKAQLDKEKKKFDSMKPYKQKLYKAKQQMKRQKMLQQVITDNHYNFPNPVLPNNPN